MLTLATDLLAAQRAPSVRPVLTVTARHNEAGQYAPRWTQQYAGIETEGDHNAVVTAAGTLIRVWVTDVNRLLTERRTNAGPSTTFSTAWSQRSIDARQNSGVAIATFGNEVRLFWVSAATPTNIRTMNSNDDGATWGAESTLYTEASTVLNLAAVAKPTGEIALIYSIGAATVKALRRSGSGVWTGPASASLSATDCFGVAVAVPSTGTDFAVVATGFVATTLPRLWALTLTDAGPPVFGAATVLEKSDVPTGAQFFYTNPYLLTAGRTRLAVRRQFTGNVGRPSDIAVSALPNAATLVTSRTWREPTVVDRPPSGNGRFYGMALSSGGSYMWLTSPGRVYRAPSTTPALEISADILALDIDWKPDGARLALTLDNSRGQYNGLTDAPSEPLTTGSELDVLVGCQTAGGPLTAASAPLFRVERWERRYEKGESALIIEANGFWTALERWRAPQQFMWVEGEANLAVILAFVLGRAGYALSNPTGALTSRAPAFVINPNETGTAVARRIVSHEPVVLVERHGVLELRAIASNEAESYSYTQ